MKVEFINPFANAAFNVLEKEVNLQFERGQLTLKPSPLRGNEVNVVVGVTGDVEGQVILSLTSDTAKSLASLMMGGAPVEEFDDLAKSAISELGNVITGNAAIALSNNNFSAVLTPPTLFTGRELIMTTVMPVLVIPMHSSIGGLEIYVALRENK